MREKYGVLKNMADGEDADVFTTLVLGMLMD